MTIRIDKLLVAQQCDCKCDCGFDSHLMSNIFNFGYYIKRTVSSTTQHAMPREFGGKFGTEVF